MFDLISSYPWNTLEYVSRSDFNFWDNGKYKGRALTTQSYVSLGQVLVTICINVLQK